jgi:hypothetical protein
MPMPPTSPSPEKNEISGKVLNIVRNSLMGEIKDPAQVQQLIGSLGLLLQQPGNKLIQFGNSVFLVMVKAPGEVEVHTFSAETPENLIQNYIKGAAYLKKIGVKKITTYSDNPAFQKVAKSTGLPVKINQTVKQQGGEMKPVYEYVLEF